VSKGRQARRVKAKRSEQLAGRIGWLGDGRQQQVLSAHVLIAAPVGILHRALEQRVHAIGDVERAAVQRGRPAGQIVLQPLENRRR